MKFSLENRFLLLKELALMRNVVREKRTVIPALGFTLFTATGKTQLELTGTNLDQTLMSETVATVQKPGAIALPTDKLHRIVTELPDDVQIDFELKPNNRMSIVAGRAKFQLAGLAADEFPAVEKHAATNIQIPSAILAEMIDSTKYATTKDESRYTLAAAKLMVRKTGLRMVACDGHRLALTETRSVENTEAGDCLIPDTALGALAKLCALHEGDVGLLITENQIGFEIGERKFITRQLTGTFPEYEKVVPKKNERKATIKTTEFAGVVRRVAIMAPDKTFTIALEFSKNTLTIKTTETDEGSAEEKLKIEYDGGKVTIGVNANYLTEFLAITTSEELTCEFKDSTAQILMKGVGRATVHALGVIMPMRLNETQTGKQEQPPADAASNSTEDKENLAQAA